VHARGVPPLYRESITSVSAYSGLSLGLVITCTTPTPSMGTLVCCFIFNSPFTRHVKG
jgi:phage terminase large subunit-like protein